jgi:hypothetical protein
LVPLCLVVLSGGYCTVGVSSLQVGVVEENSSLLKCANNEACDDDMFCSQGNCQKLGLCVEDIDCHNPSNSYKNTKCRGHVTCQQGACTGCAEGVEGVQCLVQPCSESTCPESVVCVDDYCGACHFVHFDAAGYQVCG